MKYEGKSRRIRERMKLALPVRVQCREAGGGDWVEVTRLYDVTPFGAGFTLGRLTEPGRLLHLTLPMPRQLRCFDYAEQQYRIWALVRHVKPFIPAETADEQTPPNARFEIGVAFTGKHPPASYLRDPATRYEIAAASKESDMWEVCEKTGAGGEGEEAATEGGGHGRSAETRLQVPLDVMVEIIDVEGGAGAREQTVTENISRRGAAVYTSLAAERGSFVRLTGMQSNLTVLAVVRARRNGPDGIPRLHLEFIDKLWPLEGVD